ncbi:hypothetical protein PH210_08540 [Paenibacillus sp. BSR1-1]|uniref:hypothetical protein n=1 Tax=Paenibacillus sp. BSR1-1 TaxID=3020845 RepID=UPI0025B1D729|nr:hypothetical protein [Paenibacillus sp. BSR1-1]MDN3016245.1 hypothetical protein [Paenibacillus sp. BSR1-1]
MKSLRVKGLKDFQFEEADASGEFEKQVEVWKTQLLMDACKVFGLTLNKHREAEGKELRVQFIHNSKDSSFSMKYDVVQSNINRILRRFQFNGDEQVVISTSRKGVSHLPFNYPVSLHELLSQYVNLEAPASRKQILELAAYTVCPPHKYELEALVHEGVYEKHIVENQVTMLDLFEKYEACEMPFEHFLALLLPLNKLPRITT